MPPKFKFSEGDRVLCYHGPLLYEARCLKFAVREKQNKYWIHYLGWNKNWDEWVPEDRVLKYNDANVQKQKDALRTHGEQISKYKKGGSASKLQSRKSDGTKDKEKEGNSRASTPISIIERTSSRGSKSLGGSSTPTASHDSLLETPRRKRGRTEHSTDTEEFKVKTQFGITIPTNLKYLLIDEHDTVVNQKKLPSFPMSITIEKVLNNYVESIEGEKVDGVNKETALEVMKGIKEYFNTAVNLHLLYKWERPHFEENIPEDSDILPSQMYGPYYLLRLFVKLGHLLSYTAWSETSVRFLMVHFHHLLQYLQNNVTTLFDLQDYKDAPQEYHKRLSK